MNRIGLLQVLGRQSITTEKVVRISQPYQLFDLGMLRIQRPQDNLNCELD